jgi:5'-nucleotidase
LKILIDCDGVLSNFNQRCLDRINRECGLDLRDHSCVSWDWLEKHPDVPAADLKRLVDEWIHERDFVRHMEVMPGAQEAVRELRDVGEVVCVTSPWKGHATWASERHAWLEEHFGFKDDDIVQTSGKHHVYGNLLIDDKPSNIDGWISQMSKMGIVAEGVLWAMPHNATAKLHARVERSSRWARAVWIASSIRNELEDSWPE